MIFYEITLYLQLLAKSKHLVVSNFKYFNNIEVYEQEKGDFYGNQKNNKGTAQESTYITRS